MAFTEAERQKYEGILAAFIEKRRPPVEIRHKLDFGYRISGQNIEIFEIRQCGMTPPGSSKNQLQRQHLCAHKNIGEYFGCEPTSDGTAIPQSRPSDAFSSF